MKVAVPPKELPDAVLRSERFDLVIVGGGTAGLVAAHGAAGIGARVALVERAEQTGGDCLWTGCVPSKSLIAAADLAQRMRTAATVGLAPVEPDIDFARVMDHVHRARRTIEPHDSIARLQDAGVEVVRGQARFTGPRHLEVDGVVRLRFRAALIATGSRPVVPDIDGLAAADPLTNETVWDLQELPRRLVVLGGGPVGCELGQAFARLGSHVSLVQRGPDLLTKEEPEARALVADRLRLEGVDVRTASDARRVEPDGQGGHRLVLADGTQLPFDRVLVATGRRPDTAGLGLDAAGVAVDDEGAVAVDKTLRTSARRIFAAGDVTGGLPFTHVAGHHGRVVVGNALFGARQAFDTAAVPWVTFTDPEVGRVGLTEAQARARFGDRVTVAAYDDQLDRAVTAGVPYGFVKLVAGPRGRLVGATVAAPGGGEAIAELAARVAAGDKIAAISRQVHAYPTFAEGPARAADDHLRRQWFTPRTRLLTRPVLALLRLLDRARGRA